MAITSIDITIKNNPVRGFIEFNSQKNTGASDQISYVLISRRVHGEDDYDRIYEKVITNTDQLTFYDFDIGVKCGTSYDYYIELTDGNSIGYTIIEFGEILNVECWFDGLFIGNYEKQYMAPLNCSTSVTRNTQANYVMTLAGRTPYRVSNTSANYTTGQSSGLFMPLDNYNQPVKMNTREYTEEIVDFLVDGTEKVLKTSDGEAWLVSIDPGIEIPSSDYFTGLNTINFNWTEIGDVPAIKEVTTE